MTGAALLLVLRLISPGRAWLATRQGTDVYLFLTGMMLLSELARREGVFDWLAARAEAAARGSPRRLFALVYVVGILVTVFLSNDATAVVLTPAVLAAVRRARVEPLPYLFACAFIANAASFVLPISNPANLVVYGAELPALAAWLRIFALPSVLAIAATFGMLFWIWRPSLTAARLNPLSATTASSLTPAGTIAAWGLCGAACILILCSAAGISLGWPACVTGFALVAFQPSRVPVTLRGVYWGVIPLVAGLFVIVESLRSTGALDAASTLFAALAHLSPLVASLSASFGVAALSNMINNLPAGLLTADVVRSSPGPAYLRHALLIGVDLGPNLSVTGSLATILWLIALRRDNERVSPWTFLKAGALVMPPALLLATAALVLTASH